MGVSQIYNEELVKDAIQHCLTVEEAEIFNARFGLNGGKCLTLNEIESRFGVSPRQMRETENKVLIYLNSVQP